MTRAMGKFLKGAISLLVFKTLNDRQVVTVDRKITGVGRELHGYGIIREICCNVYGVPASYIQTIKK